MTTFRAIAVVEGRVALVREGVLVVVATLMRRVGLPRRGAGGPVVVVGGRVGCGPPRNLDPNTVFIGNHLL